MVAFAAAAPAHAVLRSTDGPLAGSSFQGADGNQDDAPPLTDWAGVNAAGRVVHSPDPSAADSAFAGGSKEDEPGEWDLTTEPGGVSPAKSNVLDAWSSLDQPGRDTFLYLGFTREGAEGTTWLTFELNQDARLWDNGRARIPCRTTGDVVASYVVLPASIELVLARWTTTVADPATGCARKGRVERAVADPKFAQGGDNDEAIASRLPGALGPTIEPRLFGEAALNLPRLLEDGFGDGCFAFTSVWMHTRSSDSETSNMQDYVAPRPLQARRCSAAGTKFFDRDADGVRDPDDPGIPRFEIWADYDDDGVLDADEPFAITDDDGEYVINDIRPPSGSYRLRERLLTRLRRTVTDWRCSFPNASTPGGFTGAEGRFGCGWGPIRVADTPYATGKDFGNWYPARLAVRKRLSPPDDPRRFDLLVNGQVVVAAAGDRDGTTLEVPPGSYTVEERAVEGTDPTTYRSTVECKVGAAPAIRRPGASFGRITLQSGASARCTARNVRPGMPAIAIDKTGPSSATAGDTLRYAFVVTNVGDVAFAAADVSVDDPRCDAPPRRTGKAGAGGGPDASPRTLDPGDTWTYGCSRSTRDPGEDCVPGFVTNTGTVSAEAGGAVVGDDSTTETFLRCPDRPSPPLPVPGRSRGRDRGRPRNRAHRTAVDRTAEGCRGSSCPAARRRRRPASRRACPCARSARASRTAPWSGSSGRGSRRCACRRAGSRSPGSTSGRCSGSCGSGSCARWRPGPTGSRRGSSSSAARGARR